MKDNGNAVRATAPDNQPVTHRTLVDITYSSPDGERCTRRFGRTFRIGRSQDCEVQISDPRVSREHLQVYREGEHWWLRDLGSSNGTYLNGRMIRQLPLTGKLALELGDSGPLVQLDLVSSMTSTAPSDQPPDHFEHSHQVQAMLRKQAWRYRTVIAVAMLLLLSVGCIALYHYLKIRQANELAINMFYNMKALELQIADLEDKLSRAAPQEYLADIAAKKQELDKLRQQYQDFIKTLGVVEARITDDVDRLILNIAQLFGECEVNMPPDFVAEVKRYIARWQSSSRLQKAIAQLHEKGYASVIYKELTYQQLPPQFLYLALQESNFEERAVGPPTRYGRAKGMWQFIPYTAAGYGLRIGLLQDSSEYDPADERHDPVKSSRAAAMYLRNLYKTDAQASGLLVMASYNWGEGNVLRLIRQMPLNPKERNFWQLLAHYRIPQETYDYVFYIFSAAVIGQNPKLFGFSFDNPLQGLAVSPPSSTTAMPAAVLLTGRFAEMGSY